MDITAIIVAVLSLVGVVITSVLTHRKTIYDVQSCLAVMTEQVTGMRKELEEMNKEVKNIPVMLYRIDQLEQKLNRMEEKFK
ncbi:MAG: hypothetical protein J5617_04030 [Bacilli bacterium]|nr:hypothetical protein [Bacilli bacterium]